MTDSVSQPLPAPTQTGPSSRPRHQRSRLIVTVLLWLFVAGNVAVVIWIWGSGGENGQSGPNSWHTFTEALTGAGEITALLAGFLALVEVLLLARLPPLERAVGFGRLTIWHRWNGHAVVYLVLAHVVFTVWGFARTDDVSWLQEYWNWLTLPQRASTAGAACVPRIKLPISNPLQFTKCPTTTSPYPGIITATIGTALLLVVVVTSLVIVKRTLSYEWWYAVHLTAYVGIALAWFHMVPDGNNLHAITWARDYWTVLFIAAGVLVAWYRLLRPIGRAIRVDMKVSEVVQEGPGVVSLRITGRNLDSLHAQPGQWFFWRFLTKGFWYTQLPMSLSEVPDGKSFRITVKDLGDHTSRIGQIPIGTSVYTEGPFGLFTDDARVTDKSLLIAGGIGITPVLALMERMGGDMIALYRVDSAEEIVFADELDAVARRRGARVYYVVGHHATPDGRELLSPGHLIELVPDITERDVFICGPVGMINSIIPQLRDVHVPRHHLHVERFAF
jgi:predicted ferric reductase